MSGPDRYRSPDGIVIPVAAVRFSFARSGGPGGQHVNTASTKVRVAVDLRACGFDEDTEARLVASFGDEIHASSEEHRSQARNREAAMEKVLRRIDRALAPTRPRRPTRPSKAARERRLEAKSRQSQRKAERRRPGRDDGRG